MIVSYYEQASSRFVATSPGTIVLAEPGVRRALSIIDKATLDSWFKKDDYNQFLLVPRAIRPRCS